MNTVSSVESIAELITISNPTDTQTLYVKSYYLGLNKGGDFFTYNSELASTNNEVTIFNGWVRDLTDSILTTDDAGLLGNETDTNLIYCRIQTLLTAAKNNFTVILKGSYKFSKPLELQNTSNLTINLTDFKYSANADWTFNVSVIPAGTLVPRGMIIACRCPRIRIIDGDITGLATNNKSTQVATDPFQDGDSGIQLFGCDLPIIEYCTIRNTFAWGILAEQCIGAIVRFNDISDVYRQSGINCVVGATSDLTTCIYGNTLRQCALYGIEIEVYTDKNHVNCFDNTIDNCYSGIVVTSHDCAIFGRIHDNKISCCCQGIWCTKTYSPYNLCSIDSNTINSCYIGIRFSAGVRGYSVKSNTVVGSVPRDYFLRKLPDLCIMRIVSSTEILVSSEGAKQVAVGTTVYVKGIAMTIASITDTTEVIGSSGAMSIIKMATANLTSDMLWNAVTKLVLTGTVGESGLMSGSEIRSCLWTDNTVTDNHYGILKGGGDTAEFYEIFSNNTLDRCDIYAVLLQDNALGVRFSNNTILNSLPSNYPITYLQSNCITLKKIEKIVCSIAKITNEASIPTNTLYMPTSTNILACYLIPKDASTTGTMAVTINGTNYIANNSGVNPILISTRVILNEGANTISIVDTIGDLHYSGYELIIFTD